MMQEKLPNVFFWRKSYPFFPNNTKMYCVFVYFFINGFYNFTHKVFYTSCLFYSNVYFTGWVKIIFCLPIQIMVFQQCDLRVQIPNILESASYTYYHPSSNSNLDERYRFCNLCIHQLLLHNFVLFPIFYFHKSLIVKSVQQYLFLLSSTVQSFLVLLLGHKLSLKSQLKRCGLWKKVRAHVIIAYYLF